MNFSFPAKKKAVTISSLHTISNFTTISSNEQDLHRVLHRQYKSPRSTFTWSSATANKNPAAIVIFDRCLLRQNSTAAAEPLLPLPPQNHHRLKPAAVDPLPPPQNRRRLKPATVDPLPPPPKNPAPP
jgi:hypothetical protein